MTKKDIATLLFLAYLILNTKLLSAQKLNSFFVYSDNIKTWFLNKTEKEKIEIANNLKNHERMKDLFEQQSNKSEFYSWFNILDFNQDGIADIYYKGYSGAESNAVILFEGRGNGQFVKIFEVFGNMIGSNAYQKHTNLSFTVYDYPCCAGYVNFIEQYSIKNDSTQSQVLLMNREAYIDATVFPKQLLKQPIAFKTKNERYKLRYEPKINDEGKDEMTEIIGNIIAEYPKDSKGVALAEEVDSTGRKWWFVKMFNNLTPISSAFYHGNNNESAYYTYGWMSSSFLEIIK